MSASTENNCLTDIASIIWLNRFKFCLSSLTFVYHRPLETLYLFRSKADFFSSLNFKDGHLCGTIHFRLPLILFLEFKGYPEKKKPRKKALSSEDCLIELL